MTALVAALRRAVGQATLAPSVNNTQPWRFVLYPDRLDVYADSGRQLKVLDPSGRQLALSVGCALFNARVSLAASGYAAEVDRLPHGDDANLLAQLRPAPGGADPALAKLDAQVRRRQSNRRRFSDDPVPDDLIGALMDAVSLEGAVLFPVREFEDRLTVARLTQRADAAQVRDPAYRAELRAWTTTDPGRRDGVRAAAVPHVDGTAEDDVPIRDFDSQGAGGLPGQTRSSVNQCLLLIGTEGDGPPAWLRAGEALQRAWLTLTEAGYVASLFTQPVEVATVRAQLRSQLHLTIYPHLLMRVGRAPVTAATLRRHVDEVLDDRTVLVQ